MKKLLLSFALLCVLRSHSQQTPAFVTDSLEVYVNRALREWQIPGVSVCIVKDGKLVLAKGYGLRKMDTGEQVDENTLFMIGSNTKAFTSTALAMLAAEKKISLDDKVVHYWPEFRLYEPWVTKEVNVRDLLSHRLGFETFQGDFMFFDSDLKKEEIFEKWSKLKPLYGFRSRWGYSNAAFAAAGELNSRITGKPWAEIIRNEILKPLGMDRTTATLFDLRKSSNLSMPHTIQNGKLNVVAFNDIDALAPAGSMASSAVDIGKWMLTQLDSGRVNGKPVIPWSASRATREPQSILGSGGVRFNTGHFALYGLGWFLQEYDGREVISHTGGINGFVTSVTLVPEERLGIAVFTNTDMNNFYESLRWELLDAYFGLPYRNYSTLNLREKKEYDAEFDRLMGLKKDTVSMNPATSLPLSAYTGDYEHEVYGKMNIRQVGKLLEMHFEHHSGKFSTLEPLGGNRFLSTWNDPLYGVRVLSFQVENAKVRSITVRVGDFIEFTPYLFRKLE